jgi:glycosyltransferase involved in cell wall biosynthesis
LFDASVILVVKDEPSIARSLHLLAAQCMKNNAECIVVDASEGRLQSISHAFGWVRWISYQQPPDRKFTIGHQRNVGVRAATSNAIAFCDAGGEPDAEWLGEILQALQTHPGECVCGPTLSLDDPPTPPVNLVADGVAISMPATGNMAFLKNSFDAIGGFDERFDHGEDMDFGWRLRESGFGISSAGRAIMRMHFGNYHRQRRRAWFYGRATPYLLRRHRRSGLLYLRHNPDNIFYPAWLLGLPLSLAASLIVWWVPLMWIALIGIVLIKNRHEPKIGQFLVLKVVRASGFLSSIPKAVFASSWRGSWQPNN